MQIGNAKDLSALLCKLYCSVFLIYPFLKHAHHLMSPDNGNSLKFMSTMFYVRKCEEILDRILDSKNRRTSLLAENCVLHPNYTMYLINLKSRISPSQLHKSVPTFISSYQPCI
jgi:hypothetical protein